VSRKVVTAATSTGAAFRLFVAVAVPADVASSIEEAIGPWKAAVPAARWARPERRHLTLRFLGPTDPGRITWVEDRLARVAERCPPFVVRVRGLGAFPSLRTARVLWVGVDDEAGSLGALADAVRDGIAAEDPPDRRPFSPHVTVARCDPPISVPEPDAAAALVVGTLPVGEILLVRSHLGAAPRYETLARFPLGGVDSAPG
jgi:2'-5' RNA ligase